MPHYKTINANHTTQVLVWKITETVASLFSEVELNDSNLLRFNAMKSESHKKEFLSIRKLLQNIGYTDFDLFYDHLGKPHLKDGKNISITHSFYFSAIIISNQTVGIDIELRRDKIMNIADKFITYEFSFLNKEDKTDYIRKLNVIWGVKEALYKLCIKPKMSFKRHVKVIPFEMEDKQGKAWLKFEDINKGYPVYFEEIEEFTLVYVFGESFTF